MVTEEFAKETSHDLLSHFNAYRVCMYVCVGLCVCVRVFVFVSLINWLFIRDHLAGIAYSHDFMSQAGHC